MSTVDTLTGNGMDDLKELQQRLNYEFNQTSIQT